LLLDQFVPVLPHLILPRRSNDTGGFSHKELQAGYLPVGGRTPMVDVLGLIFDAPVGDTTGQGGEETLLSLFSHRQRSLRLSQ
jgi:hypothetical protein